ncbi:hypothetical protein QCE63_04385 [Caballeronia sp. LZ065]|uniref:hypothetical protein n=1 Tax=Caballeronia sp. LZ065 TaxID=3038571 RepID=UPI00285F7180|nr:hypothetical protein [Caballeronia sp. LZ065]MDR5778669.1 hypothetical protein [Caballeronia sp. LZ065]
MSTSGLNTAARQLLVGLPFFMGAIEYLLRVALKQPGQNDFFPISLVAPGVSLNVGLTSLPRTIPSDSEGEPDPLVGRAIVLANLGVFACLFGVLPWIYLLVASFSQEVREILLVWPYRESTAYYVLSFALSEIKARNTTC